MGWEPTQDKAEYVGPTKFCPHGIEMSAASACDKCHSGNFLASQPSEGIGELIERLMIANLKLWAVCDKKANAANMSQEDLRVLVSDDLNLCKSRAAIRAEINKRLGSVVSGETVKHYASGIGPFGGAKG